MFVMKHSQVSSFSFANPNYLGPELVQTKKMGFGKWLI